MKKYFVFISLIIVAALFILGGKALAQLITPTTEPGGEVTLTNVQPSYISGDPAYQGVLPPDDNPPSGITSPQVLYSYFTVSGATLRGRSSVTQYVYEGSGCSYTTAGTDTQKILNTELHLPDHAVIKYLRIYINDTNPKSSVDGFLTRYTPGQPGALDLTSAQGPDPFSGGFTFIVSPQITETVNNDLYAYTLIAYPDENSITNQACGLRIAYYTPIIANVFLPAVKR